MSVSSEGPKWFWTCTKRLWISPILFGEPKPFEMDQKWKKILLLNFTLWSIFIRSIKKLTCPKTTLEATGIFFIINFLIPKATKMLRREDGVDFNHGAISYLFNNHWQNPVLPGYLKELILSSVLQLPWW